MKSKLCYIYWTLLIISVISSGLLFIIVAAENGVTLGSSVTFEKKHPLIKDQIVNKKSDDSSTQPVNVKEEIAETLKQEERKLEEIHSSFEDVSVENVVPEKHSRQTSDAVTGFRHATVGEELSESGHAVVFTLVDSASQELQQQAAASALLPNIENETTDGLTGPITVPLPSQSDASNESEVYIVRAEPKQLDVGIQLPSDEQIKEEIKSSDSEKDASQQKDTATYQDEAVTSGTTTTVVQEQTNDSIIVNQEPQPAEHEDIPSFSEWAQKQLAEAEKKKGENKTGATAKRGLKLRSKNYASPDCGAKVISTNPEAGSAWAVLSSSRDEYLLNSCNNKIWFIVELCEAIQPKKIELANFELFSSIVREFSVYVSDRHPTRDWTLLGNFEGKEVRTIQSFNVDPPSGFFKYIKVEFHSHYGTEHYCPISLFRVYGTSEFEVLDSVDEAQPAAVSAEDEEDDDEFEEGENLEKPKNLFTSARDAVLSIVKRAAEVLAKREDELDVGTINSNSSAFDSSPCSTPAYIIVCDNCSDQHFNRVHEILSCRGKKLEQLMESQFVRNAVSNSAVCASLGLDLRLSSSGAPYPLRPKSSLVMHNEPSHYIEALLSMETMSALCNFLAITQKRVVLNITYESLLESNETVSVGQTDIPVILPDAPSTCSIDSTIPSSVPYEAPVRSDTNGAETVSTNSQIKPTKTLTAEEQLSAPVISQPNLSLETAEFNLQNNTDENVTSTVPAPQPTRNVNEDLPTGESTPVSSAEEVVLEQLTEDVTTGGDAISFDSIFSELDEADTDPSSSAQPATLSPPQLLQRESVFVRLAKRIKALERNMSLSGQYLEELSRRYKRQVEEMQRALTDVIEERKKGEEKEERRSQQMLQLSEQVASLTVAVQALTEERDSWMIKHWIVIIVEVALCALVVFVCQWLPEVEMTRSKISMVWPKIGTRSAKVERRKSVDDALNTGIQRARKRRPSEEALRISGSTHQELLIQDASRKNSRAENRRRRRKKKDQVVAVSAASAPVVSLDSASSLKYISNSSQSERKPEEYFSQPRKDEEVQQPIPPPPPPPLPPLSVVSNSKQNNVSVPNIKIVNVNGNSKLITLPKPPHYVQTALSFRKQRTSSVNSSSELTDSKDKSNTSSTSVKKTGPLKKIVRKFF